MASRHRSGFLATASFGVFLLLASLWGVRADEIEMMNGDRYVGRVVALGGDTLTLQSEVLGTVKLPRGKIAGITFARAQAERGTNSYKSSIPLLLRSNATPRAQVTLRTNLNADSTDVMRQLSESSNLVQQVQQQLLGGAGPEAQAKFNEMLGSLMTGKLDLNGLRLEAKSTLAQARNARKELGDDAGSSLDSYLAILDSFLKETEPAAPVTNSPPVALPPKKE
jgi:hypothetical protein